MPQFSTLPMELQLHINSFCSARTLFQIMRLSSALRIEASKLFWANPDAYFLVHAHWLLDGGHSGYTDCDLSFLSHVQNVEIEYDNDNDICPLHDDVMKVQQELITTYWKSFEKRFPNAKRVLVNQNWESRRTNKTEPVPQALRILIQYCPPKIEALAFIVEESPTMSTSTTVLSMEKWQRSLYRRSAGDVWTRVETARRHKTILMPIKHFHRPVSAFFEIRHEGYRVHL
jgi:hypothetical protein